MPSQTLPPGEWMPAINCSDTVIPAYACCRASGSDSDGLLRLIQPDQDGCDVVFNGPVALARGDSGSVCVSLPARALFDDSFGYDPAFEEVWGPSAGSWHLSPGKPGFKVMGGIEYSGGTVVVTACDRSLVRLVQVTSLMKVGSYYPAVEYVWDALAETGATGEECYLLELAEL